MATAAPESFDPSIDHLAGDRPDLVDTSHLLTAQTEHNPAAEVRMRLVDRVAIGAGGLVMHMLGSDVRDQWVADATEDAMQHATERVAHRARLAQARADERLSRRDSRVRPSVIERTPRPSVRKIAGQAALAGYNALWNVDNAAQRHADYWRNLATPAEPTLRLVSVDGVAAPQRTRREIVRTTAGNLARNVAGTALGKWLGDSYVDTSPRLQRWIGLGGGRNEPPIGRV